MAGIERLSLFFWQRKYRSQDTCAITISRSLCVYACVRERERERENVYVCNFLSIDVDAFSVEAVEILISSTTLACTP